jgi:Bacterial alpha-2-macroglobulin MG3 domain/Alpha-2-macroglobulin bait region domain
MFPSTVTNLTGQNAIPRHWTAGLYIQRRRICLTWLALVASQLLTSVASATSDPVPAAAEFPADVPAIVAVLPDEHVQEVDEEQVFLLRLSAPATAASVQAKTYCSVRDSSDRIPVTVLSGQDRQSMLDLFEVQGDSITVLRCQGRLPASASMALHWGPGITTPSGVVMQSEQTFKFHVRQAFQVLVSCAQAFSTVECLPTGSIAIRFTAAVPRELALSMRLVPAEGADLTPSIGGLADAPLVNQIYFAPPFRPASAMTVTLPGDLVDDAGRSPENSANFPQHLMIGVSPPFPQPFFVLQGKGGTQLPIFVRDFETSPPGGQSSATMHLLPVDPDPKTVREWIARAEAERRFMTSGPRRGEAVGTASIFNDFNSPEELPLVKLRGERVVGVVLNRPGFYVAEVDGVTTNASPPSVSKTLHESASLLLTDLAVHVKWWPAGGLVWVTRLSDGRPVANADVTVDDYCNSGGRLWEGRTGREGTAIIDVALGSLGYGANCVGKDRPFITIARSKGDFSFTLSDWRVQPDSAWINRLVGLGYSFGGRPPGEGTSRRPRLPKLEPAPSVRPAVLGPDLASPQTAAGTLRLGVRQEVSEPGKLRVRVIASNRDGNPKRGEHVVVTLYHINSTVGPERVRGGFYIYVDVTETKKLDSTCRGLTGKDGTFVCDLAAPTQLGLAVANVESEDSQAEVAGASVLLDNIDTQSRLFSGNLIVLPEKLKYAPGETARMQVRTSFPSATALVTVERDGIVSSFVTRLHGKTSIVKVPILPRFGPAALVSVLAIDHRESPSANETRNPLAPRTYLEGTACIVVAPHAKDSAIREETLGAERDRCSARASVQTATMLSKVANN